MVTSNIIPGKTYNAEKCVYITCIPQVQFYMQREAELLDILYNSTKTNQLVFIFEKNTLTKKLYEEWKSSKPQ